jgi:hypothetical protein
MDRVAARLGDDIDPSELADDELLALLDDTTDARKALELVVASASAEVSRRSTRDLGYSGLAQRRGLRTGAALVQQVTGMTRGDVNRAVRAGEELVVPIRPDTMAKPGSPRAPVFRRRPRGCSDCAALWRPGGCPSPSSTRSARASANRPPSGIRISTTTS